MINNKIKGLAVIKTVSYFMFARGSYAISTKKLHKSYIIVTNLIKHINKETYSSESWA